MGHEVQALGVHDDLGDIRRASRPSGSRTSPSTCSKASTTSRSSTRTSFSHLELLKLSYTGCNPRGLLLARDKSLSKKLLAYHRIPVPEFEVFRIGRPIRRPKRLAFPLIVKSLTQEASIGISQASVVDSDEKLKERVTFIHESIGTAAIVEQYIEGRELYVGILGNQALQALPVWELFFTNMPEDAKRIATDRVKWSVKYQKKYGIDSGPAKDLPEAKLERDPAPLQARLPRARAERLRAHRPAAGRGGQRLGARSEPEPADCEGRGLRRVGRKVGHRATRRAAADPQSRIALAARECRVMAQMSSATNASGSSGENSAAARRQTP